MLLDPVTLDYVVTEDGEWEETPDSRTTVLIMQQMELGASPFDPGDGTTIGARFRLGDPVQIDDVKADTLRAQGILARDGVIAELDVQVRDSSGKLFFDETGRPLVRLRWRDLASGSIIDQAITTTR